jgi:hypothetical protein
MLLPLGLGESGLKFEIMINIVFSFIYHQKIIYKCVEQNNLSTRGKARVFN